MATATQLHQYCLDHGFTLTQGTHHMPFPSINWTIVGLVLAAFIGFEVGHYGLVAIYNWIKAKVTNASTSSTTVTQTATTTATPIATA